MITYDSSQFAIWEATVQRRQAANEVVRQQIVTALLAWLDTREADFDIKEAWIFGSATRPNQFGAYSDIDVALVADPDLQQFQIMSALLRALDRNIDVILLDDCRFTNSIIRAGIQWIQSR